MLFRMNFQIATDRGAVPCSICEYDSTPARLASTLLYLWSYDHMALCKCDYYYYFLPSVYIIPRGLGKKAIQNGYDAQSVQSEAYYYYYYYYIFTYPKPINGTKYTRCCTHIRCHCSTTWCEFADWLTAAWRAQYMYMSATGCVVLQQPPSHYRFMLSFWEYDTIELPHRSVVSLNNTYTFTGLKPVNGYKLYPLSHLHWLTLLYYSFCRSLSVACVGRQQICRNWSWFILHWLQIACYRGPVICSSCAFDPAQLASKDWYIFTCPKPFNGYKMYPLSHMHLLVLLYYLFRRSLCVACVGPEQVIWKLMGYSASASKSLMINNQQYIYSMYIYRP